MGVGRVGRSSRSPCGVPAARRARKLHGGSSPGSTSVASGACSSRSGSASSSRLRPAWRRSRRPGRRLGAAAWDAALAGLPPDWSDLLCALDLTRARSSPRAALLCAPLNPARDRDRAGFTFRSARRAGYGVSPAMARRCFERLDEEEIQARVSVLRLLSDTDNVATQGAVWYVGGKAL